MNNKNFKEISKTGLLFSVALYFPLTSMCQENSKKPNIVWFMAEDVAKHYMQIYNTNGTGTGAVTPNVEKLAKEGIIFNHAFCNAPVSSAARSSLFTGMYAPRVGMSWHRALDQVNLPDGVKLLPAYLKEAGYYTYNSTKTDYNCVMPTGSWDEAKAPVGEWRNRLDKSKPFFYVQTCTISHESSLHFSKDKMKDQKTKYNLADVLIAPNHPDTELFRYTYATFYDRIQDADKELGLLIMMLEEENELDNTFIFFFGDNGGALPGTKGYTDETGLNVPLVVYIPNQWRDKINIPIGSHVDGFVSFLDFGPTILHLAGLKIPAHLDGQPFLGTDIFKDELNKRDITYGYGDRFDELYSFSRTIRKGKYKYRRNFTPYQPQAFFAFYRYKMEAFQEWKQMYQKGQLNSAQSKFFEPQLAEELYDIEKDPFETNNLAKDPAFSTTLRGLRTQLTNHMIGMKDLGFFPESEWLKAKDDPVSFGKQSQQKMKKYSKIIDLSLTSFSRSKKQLSKALQSTDPNEIFWGLTVCMSFKNEVEPFTKYIIPLLDHSSPIIKSRAAMVMTMLGKIDPSTIMREALNSARSGAESLIILGDIAYVKDYITGPVFTITDKDVKYKAGSYLWRVEYINKKNN